MSNLHCYKHFKFVKILFKPASHLPPPLVQPTSLSSVLLLYGICKYDSHSSVNSMSETCSLTTQRICSLLDLLILSTSLAC